MSLFSSGAFVGTGLGLVVVATASPFISWRMTFGIVGLSGLAIAALTLLLVKEPSRITPQPAGENTLKAIISLVSLPSFRWTAICIGFALTASTSAMSWVAPFLSRSHGMTPARTVSFLAVVWGLGGTCGTVVLGTFTNWTRRFGPGPTAVVIGCIVATFSGFYCMAFWSGSVQAAMVGVFVAVFFLGGVRGPTFALLQDITLNSRHATANALMMSFAQLFGAGVGPLAVGMISDATRPALGAESLRHALFIVVSASGVLGALSMFMAARSVKADMPHLPASA
jgi:predicted MFS family arabinose efflux permease